MYFKTLLATLFLVHAVVAELNCYKCDSSKGDTNCKGWLGVGDEACEIPPSTVSSVCLEYAEIVNDVTRYVRECSVREDNVSPCVRMKDNGRNLLTCSDCRYDNCNKSIF
ncbi:hypothetical protein PPYR_02993 [Photinus pyralis]|uniref:Protein sleepless n=1 Tax=Photinus pyralis TaxID=7054 RepID=A0A1Y1NK39_PHOPY|nr:uncharacterized protein LOC116162185 [Photinus pyralis]XP_031331594.1 uncharacterized protein LOC116162187 [Photinus pyralis]KAB0791193.1 hypothetical protein PPYR_02993 [Photinus pyralis]